MDFNTGSSGGRPDDQSRPLSGEETGGTAGGPPRGPAGGTGQEFSLSDPAGSFVRTVQSVLSKPVAFFRSMARRGDFINPAVYVAIIAFIAALLGGLLSVVIFALFAAPGDTAEAVGVSVAGLVGSLILGPVLALITVLIAAGVFHLLVLLLVRPTNAGFEATLRAVCYSYTPNILGILSPIPILGPLIALAALVYSVILSIFGIREVHNTTTGRALAIVLIPVAVLLWLVLTLGAAAVFFVSQQQQF